MRNKIIFVLLILIISFNSTANCKTNHFPLIMNELTSFIDTVKSMSADEGKYYVYVMNFLYEDSISVYFSCGYIMNEFNLNYIHANYFATYQSEIILIQINDDSHGILRQFGAQKIEESNINTIKEKLFNESMGFISGVGEGKICRIKNGVIKTQFYNNASKMPNTFKFYDVDKIWENVHMHPR